MKTVKIKKQSVGASLAVCVILAVTSILPAMAGASSGQAAAATPRFFESLYDVPIMPGIEEFRDQAVLFDKPDGRIASVTAGSLTLAKEEVQTFYNDTLAQMGWKKTAENQYVRGKDRLEMTLERKGDMTFVRFTLSPAR